MADKITEIIDQSAIDQVNKMKEDLKLLADKFQEAFKQATAFNEALRNATGIGLLKQHVSGASVALTEMGKVVQQTITAEEKLSIVQSQQVKNLIELKQAQSQATAGLKANAQEALAAEGSINQMKARLKSLQLQYNALSETSRETVGKSMLADIQKYDTALTKLESQQGNFTRKVGNYQGAVLSLSQVIRELPAFTYSAQMGFLAIGNNMPILIDQFKILQKEVGSTGKAIKIFAMSMFSFVNIFTIASGLFTIFYKDIMDFIRGVDSAKSSVSYWTGSVLEAKKEMLSLYETMILFKQGLVGKTEFLKEYNETLGKTAGMTNDVDKAEKNINAHAPDYIDIVYMKVKAQEALAIALEATQKAEQMQADWWTVLKAQASKGWKDFTQTGNPFLLFSADPKDAYNEYKKQAEAEAKAKREAYEEIRTKNAIKFKAMGLDDLTGKKAKKAKKAKEVDRVKELEEAYKREMLVAENYHIKNNTSEEQYQLKQLSIIEKYSDRKLVLLKNLNANERNSKLDFENDMLKLMEKIADDRYKDLEKGVKLIEKYDKKKEVLELKHQKHIAHLIAKAQKDAEEKRDKNIKKRQAKEIEQQRASFELSETLTSVHYSIIGSILDGYMAREQQYYDYKNQLLSDTYDNQMRFIEQSGMSEYKKQKEKQKLDAETSAKRKKINEEHKKELVRFARLAKQLDLGQTITQTALAVVRALTDKAVEPYYLRVINAVSAGAIGAAQIARIASTPLPQYAEGTDSHKGGAFIAGEAGVEKIIMPDGRSFYTPNKATIFPDMPKGTKVISNDELMQNVYNTAMVKLATKGQVTADKMIDAQLEAYSELKDEVIVLQQILKAKNFSLQNNDLSGFTQYKNSKIK